MNRLKKLFRPSAPPQIVAPSLKKTQKPVQPTAIKFAPTLTQVHQFDGTKPPSKLLVPPRRVARSETIDRLDELIAIIDEGVELQPGNGRVSPPPIDNKPHRSQRPSSDRSQAPQARLRATAKALTAADHAFLDQIEDAKSLDDVEQLLNQALACAPRQPTYDEQPFEKISRKRSTEARGAPRSKANT